MRWAIVLVCLAGCALTSRSAPVEVRYFSPEVTAPSQDSADLGAEERPRVRLGRVSSATHLRGEIATRSSALQVDHYDARRWTERPDVYVRRSLQRALFHDRGLVEAVRGVALVLDVEVIEFEEVRHPQLGGRVQLGYRLSDRDTVVDSGVIEIERTACGAEFDAVVAAIGAAMAEATAKIADNVAREAGAPSAERTAGATPACVAPPLH